MNRSLIQSRRRLDILVCCAAPALLPLSLESSSVERINDYVHRSLSLVSVPLAVFLESVAENDGWAVVISSQAVHTWPVAWPHYVSAKAAIEALTAVAARQYRRVSFLIVRPPKLATDLTSSPLAFENPLAPETVAEAIVRRLEGARHPGEVELMELSSSGAWALAASGPESPSP
jgi:NAD(P)-dependent dehydrogenase (short-subunit alcohol dehydrogenase family)